MMSKQAVAKFLNVERLESRCLLAIDLEVAVDDYTLESPGDVVSRYVRVFNNGDEDSHNTLIQSRVTEQLDDVTWTRESGYARVVRAPVYPPLTLENAEFSIRDAEGSYFTAKTIGDVNGDSHVDFGLRYHNQNAWVVFGGQPSVVVREGQLMLAGAGKKALGFEVHVNRRLQSNQEPSPLGDLNSDGVDDFMVGNVVIFGDRELHLRDEEMRLPSVNPGEGFVVMEEDRSIDMNSPGDLNADGVGDIVFSTGGKTAVIWGGPAISADGSVSIETIGEDPSHSTGLIVSNTDLGTPVDIGDINGDGYEDVGLYRFPNAEVLLSGPDFATRDAEARYWHSVRPEHACSPSGISPNAGDLNGDGIDDLVLYGGEFCGLRLNPPAESYVILGRETGDTSEPLGAGSPGVFRFAGANGVRTDFVDEDDVMDLVTWNSVILGGENLAGRDLHTSAFDGVDGYRLTQPAPHGERLDLNADGEQDRFERLLDGGYAAIFSSGKPNYPRPPKGTSDGVGDIVENVSLPAGQSFIYHVKGRLRANAAQEFDSFVAPLGVPTDENLRNNHDSSLQAVSLTMGVERRSVENGLVSVDVVVTNDGPFAAASVRFESSGSFEPSAAEWSTYTDQGFPVSIPYLASISPELGAYLWGEWYDHGGRKREELGRDVGHLGDLNGDGFDEVFATTRGGARIFWGSEDMGQGTNHGEFHNSRLAANQEWSLLTEVVHANTVGDIDGDGFDDFFAVTQSIRGESQRQYLVLGQADFPKTMETVYDRTTLVRSLNERRVSHQRIELAGDVDGNGAVDFLVGDRLVLADVGDSDIDRLDTNFDNANSVRFSRRFPQTAACPAWSWCGPSSEVFQTAIGDVNHDGFDDIAVYDTIFFGGPHVTNGIWDAEVSPSLHIPEARRFADGGHDVNGDGIHDLIFYAVSPTDAVGVDAEETVNVVFGGTELSTVHLPGLNGTNGFTIVVDWDSVEFEEVLASDINRDGSAEILFLASHAGLGNGAAYVFFPEKRPAGGKFDLAEIAELEHESLLQAAAMTMATGFDANGDGSNDVFWGEQAGSNSGGVGMMLGRPTNTATGDGFVDDTFDLAPGSSVTYHVTMPTQSNASVRFAATVSPAQFDLRTTDNMHVVDVKLTTPIADLNGDGQVAYDDFLILAANFGKHDADVEDGDLNDDGVVGFADFLLLSASF